jgi:drug/metabolite transporter (DMT)-like permease
MSVGIDQRGRAAVFICVAIALASSQDAIVKSVAAGYPAYETILVRSLATIPILGMGTVLTCGFKAFRTKHIGRVLLRALVLCSAYIAFILSIAAMPIANAVAIYFVMPFIVAILAGPMLGERVPAHRWLCMIAGFAGVIIMVRPGTAAFEPASLLALYSAFGYAVGAIMGRPLAQHVPSIIIANVQTLVYALVAVAMWLVFHVGGIVWTGHKSLTFLSRPFVAPTTWDFLLMLLQGALAAFAVMCFINAYKYAPSSFVAPFEYSAMIWAVMFGVLLFHDFPDFYTWIGMAVVVAAGLMMWWRDRSYKTG